MDRWMLGRCAQVQDEVRSAYQQFQFHRVVQALHNFCAVDLGGLYLDVLKDRLYTMPAASRGRRSAQTVLVQILDALLVWMAPILSFTAEEIWQHLPWRNAESVFFASYPVFELPADPALDARWQRLLQLREAVNAGLEGLRQEKKIGSALDAKVRIEANADWLALLEPLAAELRFLLLCSDSEIAAQGDEKAGEDALPGLRLLLTSLDTPKCARCWHRRSDIGRDPEHPQLCGRCIENISGVGEKREYC
ncbi:MAG: class I tRNA ligase family protein [Candidatus Igneacidithiobacillus chanchocoensis]